MVLGSISAFRLVLLHQILGVLAIVGRWVQFTAAQLQLWRGFVSDAAGCNDGGHRFREWSDGFRFRGIMWYFVDSYK